MVISNKQLIQVLKLSIYGSIFTLIAYFGFSMVVQLTNPELKILSIFYEKHGLGFIISNWLSSFPTVVITIAFWGGMALMSLIGFISTVLAKACFSKAEEIVKLQIA